MAAISGLGTGLKSVVSKESSQGWESTKEKIQKMFPNLKIGVGVGAGAVITFIASVVLTGGAITGFVIAASVVMFIALTVLGSLVNGKKDIAKLPKENTPSDPDDIHKIAKDYQTKITEVRYECSAWGECREFKKNKGTERTGNFFKQGTTELDGESVMRQVKRDVEEGGFQLYINKQKFDKVEKAKKKLEELLPRKTEQEILEILCSCQQGALADIFQRLQLEKNEFMVTGLNEYSPHICLTTFEDQAVEFTYSMRDSFKIFLATDIEKSTRMELGVIYYTHSTREISEEKMWVDSSALRTIDLISLESKDWHKQGSLDEEKICSQLSKDLHRQCRVSLNGEDYSFYEDETVLQPIECDITEGNTEIPAKTLTALDKVQELKEALDQAIKELGKEKVESLKLLAACTQAGGQDLFNFACKEIGMDKIAARTVDRYSDWDRDNSAPFSVELNVENDEIVIHSKAFFHYFKNGVQSGERPETLIVHSKFSTEQGNKAHIWIQDTDGNVFHPELQHLVSSTLQGN